MSVRCSKCGDELLGAVNRCWKCGQQFTAQPDPGGLPPVRYKPIELPPDVVLAEVAGSAEGEQLGAENILEAPAVDQLAAAPSRVATRELPASASSDARPIRSGSPFVQGAVMRPVTTPAFPRHPLLPGTSPRIPGPAGYDPVAVAGAIASILVGLFALSIAWMTSPVAIGGAILIALIGFSLGIWGLYSKRRGWALLGILISCAAIGLATYSGAIVLYESMREQDEQSEGELAPPG